jgi:5-hydroxyisourate hydrolase-like protein (transthyretin family)
MEGKMMYRVLFVTMLALTALTMGFAQSVTPPVPTDLTAALAPDAVPVVKLGWNAPSGSWGYIVYRSTDDSIHFQKLAMVNATIYLDQTVRPGHDYYYYVTSVAIGTSNILVQSGPSNIAMVRIGGTPDRPIGVIAGVVTDDSTGKPIAGVRILFTRMRSTTAIAMPFAITDNDGKYAAKLDTGKYKIKAEPAPWMPPSPPPYIPEWYNNKADFTSADIVVVSANASTPADFGLSRILIPTIPKGIITGKITDATTGKPIAGMMVRSYPQGITILKLSPTAMTDSVGVYTMTLDTGRYLLKTESLRMSPIDYISEWYDNVTDVTKATPIIVKEGATFEANFELAKPVPPTYAYIEGSVTDTLGNPLRRATVVIMRTLQELSTAAALRLETPGTGDESADVEGIGYCRGVVWKGYTDSLGYYKARVIADRAYIAMAGKWGYVPEYYDNKPNPLLADIIKVPTAIKSINFALAVNPVLQNSISGVVRDSSGNGIPSVIILFPARPFVLPLPVRFGHTDSTGTFTIGGVRTGTYVVLAVPFSKYAPAFYKEGAFGVMHWMKAEKVLISGDVSGIAIGVVPVRSIGIARLRGRILAAGSPLAGVRVMATASDGAIVGCGLTDEQGSYAMESIPPGATTLTVDAPDYTAPDLSVNVPSDAFELNDVDFVMQSQGTTDVSETTTMPSSFALHQNYPNPFNPSTTISFDMPLAGQVRLSVFNMLGQEVTTLVNGSMASGRVSIVWNATDHAGVGVASGVYFYQLNVSGADGRTSYHSVQKMLLVR